MRMTLRIAFGMAIVATLGMVSCEKENRDLSCNTPPKVEFGDDSTRVNVRLINFTGYPLCNFEIIYRKDEGTPYEYGTLDVGEVTPYTTVAFTHVYPEVTFNLGTGTFTIPDSLIYDDKYASQLQTNNGYYSFFIQTAHTLDSQTVVTYMVNDGFNP